MDACFNEAGVCSWQMNGINDALDRPCVVVLLQGSARLPVENSLSLTLRKLNMDACSMPSLTHGMAGD